MTSLVDMGCIFAVFFSLAIVAMRRIAGMIQILAVQSFILGLMPLFMQEGAFSVRDGFISLGTIVVKGILVPYMLFWAIRHVSMRSEIKPLIGFGTSIVFGTLLMAGAFWLSLSLRMPGKVASDLMIPCALATVMMGLLILVTRTRAVTQVIGYLVMENGIFLFALLLFDSMPVLIEMGILLDIFVAVFVMAIIVNHINEEFEHAPVSLDRSKMGESF